MEAFLENFEHVKRFNLEEIKSITGNFDENNVIGKGGFGKVYGGVVSDSNGQIMAAFKRLDSKFGQGNPEFLKEIIMLSHYTHENLISLLGFCDEEGEKILVYEYAAHGSLDSHLSTTTLTWTQRLKICLGAARGICYLHDPKETQQRVIHRDIKSSNILLDGNWNAKVSDMGLSKIGPANQMQSFLATNVVGTFFYIDPVYMETSILTKESDVYSFGVVLFEVLCGSLCFENKNGNLQSFVRRWKKGYKEKKLEEIICHHLKQDMKLRSLETFSEIAYGCLQSSREQRPNMSHVVEKLQIALQFQQGVSKLESEEILKAEVKKKELEILPSERFISEMKYEEMAEDVVNIEELEMLLSKRFLNKEEQDLFLSKGILVNGGKTWFSLNKNGEQCEMISGDCCDFTSTLTYCKYIGISTVDDVRSRFKALKQNSLYTGFKTHAKAQFLSPGITYTVSLVFKLERTRKGYKYLRFKLAGVTEFSTSFILHEREDGWMMTDQLCHFICNKENIDLDLTFDCKAPVLVEGIQIQSMDRVQHEQVLEEEDVDTHPDTYWDQKLPNDWEKILNMSKDRVQLWTTKKELYFNLCKGFLINDGEEWFSLANNGKKCHMLSVRKASSYLRWNWKSFPDSRFRKTACNPGQKFHMNCKSITLSPQTTYGTYLVYKLQENHSRFESPMEVHMKDIGVDSIGCYIYLLNRYQLPVYRGRVYQKKRLPQQRKDGWMEVPIWEFQTEADITSQNITVEFEFKTCDNISLNGLLVEGIEFRPI